MTRTVCVLALAAALAGCPSAEAPAERPTSVTPLLVDVTTGSGLDGLGRDWPTAGSYLAPEIMGAGVALFDADADGRLDVLQLRMAPPGRPGQPAPNALFFQQADGRFAAQPVGIEDPGYAQGVAVGDANGDGALDVYFANYGPDALYLNDGAGRFRKSDGVPTDDAWSSGATFCDADADGDLDLFVVHYLQYNPNRRCIGTAGAQDYCSPDVFPGLPDRLLLNDGRGTFTPAERQGSGPVYADGGREAKGLAVLCTDLTGDGRVDFYVANDRTPNNLWVRLSDGRFRDEAVLRGVAVNRYGKPEASMGLTVGDADGDGALELFMTHLKGENNTMYGPAGESLYRDRTTDAGMGEQDWALTGFGTAFVDLQHDGWPDLLVVNGRVRHDEPHPGAALSAFWNRYAEPDLTFLNEGNGRFARVDAAPAANVEISRGLAAGDLDGDGDLDLVVSNGDGSLRLYRNDAPPEGRHWVRVVPRTASGGEALGARVVLQTGDSRRAAAALRGSSYQSSGAFGAHFGTGAAATYDALDVSWPDGSRERFPGGAADRIVVVRQGEGSPAR